MKRLVMLLAFIGAVSVAMGTADALSASVERALSAVPQPWQEQVKKNIGKDYTVFLTALNEVLKEPDKYLCVLVDKAHALPAGYEPADLVTLDPSRAVLNKKDMLLRKRAAESLYAMVKAAKTDGITIAVSSTYRSYAYQDSLFTRYVNEMGEAEASRVSARPGHSQHQLGTAIDFGTITNDFATSKAGLWMQRHAGSFGFSLSYPQKLEELTGYSWESWHFRYISVPAVQLQDAYFLGIQQLLLVFLDALKTQ